jgi:hypothetical protein
MGDAFSPGGGGVFAILRFMPLIPCRLGANLGVSYGTFKAAFGPYLRTYFPAYLFASIDSAPDAFHYALRKHNSTQTGFIRLVSATTIIIPGNLNQPALTVSSLSSVAMSRFRSPECSRKSRAPGEMHRPECACRSPEFGGLAPWLGDCRDASCPVGTRLSTNWSGISTVTCMS